MVALCLCQSTLELSPFPLHPDHHSHSWVKWWIPMSSFIHCCLLKIMQRDLQQASVTLTGKGECWGFVFVPCLGKWHLTDFLKSLKDKDCPSSGGGFHSHHGFDNLWLQQRPAWCSRTCPHHQAAWFRPDPLLDV